MRIQIGLVACGFLLGTSVAAAQPASQSLAQREDQAFSECLKAAVAPLIDNRATPERFKMVVDGACMREEQLFLDAAEARLTEIAGGYNVNTGRVMGNLRELQRQSRAQIVSQYVVIFEGSVSKGAP